MKWKDRQGCPSCRRGMNIGDCILQVNAQKLMSKNSFLHFVVSSAEEEVRSKIIASFLVSHAVHFMNPLNKDGTHIEKR